MDIEINGQLWEVSSSLLKVTIDTRRGGNITQAIVLPSGAGILPPGGRGIDVSLSLVGAGEYSIAGDTSAEVRLPPTQPGVSFVQTRSRLQRCSGSAVGPVRIGHVERTYTFWDDLPVIRIDATAEIEPSLVPPDWSSEDARLASIALAAGSGDRWASSSHADRAVGITEGTSDAADAEGQPLSWVTLYGRDGGITVRFAKPEAVCRCTAMRVPGEATPVAGILLAAGWAAAGQPVGADDLPLGGTFWVCLHEGKGPQEFPCR